MTLLWSRLVVLTHPRNKLPHLRPLALPQNKAPLVVAGFVTRSDGYPPCHIIYCSLKRIWGGRLFSCLLAFLSHAMAHAMFVAITKVHTTLPSKEPDLVHTPLQRVQVTIHSPPTIPCSNVMCDSQSLFDRNITQSIQRSTKNGSFFF